MLYSGNSIKFFQWKYRMEKLSLELHDSGLTLCIATPTYLSRQRSTVLDDIKPWHTLMLVKTFSTRFVARYPLPKLSIVSISKRPSRKRSRARPSEGVRGQQSQIASWTGRHRRLLVALPDSSHGTNSFINRSCEAR